MPGFRIDKAKSFFNAAPIMAALEQAERAKLAQGAGYIRTTAQRSMRYKKGPAPKGSPPNAHRDTRRGPLLRKLMRFGWDASSRSALAGPLGLGADASAPSVMETGGRVTRRVRVRPKQQGGRDAAGRFRSKPTSRPSTPAQREGLKAAIAKGSTRTAKTVEKSFDVDARPFMGPALAVNRPKIVGVFADSITD